MLQKELAGKEVIVIGGSSGIGLAVAKEAAEFGVNVTLTSRSLEKAKAQAASIGLNVKGAAALDVDDNDAIASFFQDFTSIDHIYIAAGTTKIGALTDSDLDTSMGAFNTRLLGSLRVVKEVVHKMTSGGSIIFTGGASTDRPIAGAWVSGLGTASAEQLARVLLVEYPHIRFNAISPGYTDTPMWDAIMGENKAAILTEVAKNIPVKKIATCEEVAAAVILLMSNPSIAGEVIHVDGGIRFV